MIASSIHEALQQAVHEVLETMFFVRELEDDAHADRPEIPELAAGLDFEGNPGGHLTLVLDGHAARAVAADFLGADESALSDLQVEEVACELANMICGSVLSRTESETRFRLSSPQIVPLDRIAFLPKDAIHAVGLDRGALTVHLVLLPLSDSNGTTLEEPVPAVCASGARAE
jgi:chemotaxis protein CheY-P-specific phosphatase CheC